jgi:hypothetical protein
LLVFFLSLLNYFINYATFKVEKLLDYLLNLMALGGGKDENRKRNQKRV